MSSYQADWLVDDDGELLEEEEEEDDPEEGGDAMESGVADMPPPMSTMKITASRGWQNEAEDDDITLDGSILDVAKPIEQQLMEKRLVQARDDEEFPDEVNSNCVQYEYIMHMPSRPHKWLNERVGGHPRGCICATEIRQVPSPAVLPILSLAPEGKPPSLIQPHIRVRELFGHSEKVCSAINFMN
jgi:hypothetical protein